MTVFEGFAVSPKIGVNDVAIFRSVKGNEPRVVL
jgi:hypothetical protein